MSDFVVGKHYQMDGGGTVTVQLVDSHGNIMAIGAGSKQTWLFNKEGNFLFTTGTGSPQDLVKPAPPVRMSRVRFENGEFRVAPDAPIGGFVRDWTTGTIGVVVNDGGKKLFFNNEKFKSTKYWGMQGN